MLNIIDKLLKNLLNVFFPSYCYGCNKLLVQNENVLCTNCLFNLSLIENTKNFEDKILQKFYGSVPINSVYCILNYSKNGITQRLVHNLKYKNKEEIGIYLAKYLFNTIDANYFNKFTCLVPVPIHKKRLKERGYNQTHKFIETLSDLTNIPYDFNVLTREKYNSSQTELNKEERLKNVSDSFELHSFDKLNGAHILLIDDVLTTGATLQSCAKVLTQIPKVKISLLTIAIADNF